MEQDKRITINAKQNDFGIATIVPTKNAVIVEFRPEPVVYIECINNAMMPELTAAAQMILLNLQAPVHNRL